MNTATKERFSFANLNLSTRVLFLIAGTTFVVMCTLLGIAVFLYVQDKVTYIYDLQDLKTERFTDGLRRAVERASRELAQKKDLQLSEQLQKNPLEFNIPRAPQVAEVFIGEGKKGETILVRREGETLKAEDATSLADVIPSLDGVQADPDGELVYWVTSFGKLISSSHKIPSDRASMTQRPAVSVFLRNNLVKGLVTVIDDKRRVVAGFKEVPGTNTAIFIETPMSQALSPIRRFLAFSIIVGLSLIGLGVLFSAYVFGYMWRPMRMVEWFTSNVVEGNYNVQVPYRKKNEIGRLFRYLEKMAHGLQLREEKLLKSERQLLDSERQLMSSELQRQIAETTSARMKATIETAESIQNRLIERVEDLPPFPKISLAAQWIPAETCSGDWYGFHFDKEANILTGVVADVTGHGIGSALVTGVTAGALNAGASLLQILQYQTSEVLNEKTRLSLLHGVLDSSVEKCGRGKVLASALMFCVNLTSRKLFFLSAGHPAPFLYSAEAKKARALPSVGDLLGLGQVMSPEAVQELELQVGDLFFAFTDGFFENKTKDRKTSPKAFVKFMETFAAEPQMTAQKGLDKVLKSWGYEGKPQALNDDVTLLAIRVEEN